MYIKIFYCYVQCILGGVCVCSGGAAKQAFSVTRTRTHTCSLINNKPLKAGRGERGLALSHEGGSNTNAYVYMSVCACSGGAAKQAAADVFSRRSKEEKESGMSFFQLC